MKNLKKIKNLLGNNSFSWRLSINIIGLTIILFITSSLIVYHFSHKLITEEAVSKAQNILHSTNLEIENILSSVSIALQNIEDDVVAAALEKEKGVEEMYNITKKIVLKNKYIIASCIATEPYYIKGEKFFAAYTYVDNDSTISKQIGNEDYDYRFMDWYQIPYLLNKDYWTDPYYDDGGGNMVMCTYARPIFDKDNTFIGVFTADISMDWMTEKVQNIVTYNNASNILIGKSGSFIVHPNKDYILSETFLTAYSDSKGEAIPNIANSMIIGEKGMQMVEYEGEHSFAFYAPIPSSRWSSAIICPYNEVFSGVNQMNYILIIVAILGLLLIFFLTRKIITKLARPLTDFAISAREIATGNFNAQLPDIKTEDEMKELQNSFHHMQTSLTTYIDELKSTTSAKERIESELNIAREIQMGMIPKIFPPFPDRHDIDLYAILRPAKEVGGDLYDFFITDEHLYFAIGDVSGKGVPASLFMAVTRSLFRSVASTLGEPSIIVKNMNGSISETNESNMFVTMFVGILNLKNGHLSFCNAGHNPPVVMTEDGKAEYMTVEPNIPIGLFDGFEYQTQEIVLPVNSKLFLYTDGLTEAENMEKELFSDPKLIEILEDCDKKSANGIITHALNAVEKHVKDAPQSDDLTMLVINTMIKPQNTRAIVLENQVSEISKLAEFIEKLGEEFNFSMGLVMNLNLVMEELVSNVIFYAYPKGSKNSFSVEFTINNDIIEIILSDSGVPFDPTIAKEADITLSAEERPIGGLGIFLVKKIMDTVVYERKNDKNILKMTKKIE